MMGGKTPETCWAVNERQDNKLESCCIWLVIYLNYTMMQGLTNLYLVCLYRLLAVYSWNTHCPLSTDVYCGGDRFRLVFSSPLVSSKYLCWGGGGVRVHGCLSLLIIFVLWGRGRCVLGWSLVQRSPTECDVSECKRETSVMQPWPTAGCYEMGKKVLY